MIDLHEVNALIEKYLKIPSFPVAVKIIDRQETLAGGKKPLECCGHTLALCQGVAMARRFGWKLFFHAEDWACPVGMYAFGFGKEIGDDLGSEIAFPLYTETPKASVKLQRQMPRLAEGKAKTIMMAALQRTDFSPDVIIIYGGPFQIARCIQAGIWKDGKTITSSFPGRMACAYEIVLPIQSGHYQVVVPGGGERAFAGTQDHEMSFAIPKNRLADFVEGLIATHKAGANRIPTPLLSVQMKPKMPPQYTNLGVWLEQSCGWMNQQ